MNIGIIGGGAWGKALATLTAGAGHEPRIGFRGHRPTGFPGTPNLDALAQESDLLIVALPSDAVADALTSCALDAASRVVIASRGLEPRHGVWMSAFVTQHTPAKQVGALAGPALAAEVMAGHPTALVVASPFDGVCEATQVALHSEHCRIYTTSDLHGVELAGAMVDALAVAVGIAEGVDYGVGAKGVIITRGIAEAIRLGEALGADPKTFSGLAGVGDLVSRASSPQHPGFSAGLSLARGGAIAGRIIEELRALVRLSSEAGVDLPLTTAVLDIATGGSRPKLVFDALMRRSPRRE